MSRSARGAIGSAPQAAGSDIDKINASRANADPKQVTTGTVSVRRAVLAAPNAARVADSDRRRYAPDGAARAPDPMADEVQPKDSPLTPFPVVAAVGFALGAAALHSRWRVEWLEHAAGPADAERVRWVLSHHFGSTLLAALGTCIAAALLARALWRERAVGAIVGGLALAGASLGVWMGWLAGPPALPPTLETRWLIEGMGASWVLGVIATGSAFSLVLLARPRGVLGALLGFGGVALCAVVWLERAGVAADPFMVETSQVVQNLTDGAVNWDVVTQRADGPVHVAMVTPARENRLDGVDLPTLVLPPPAAVSFEVPDDDAPLWLELRAGADAEVGRGDQPAVVRWEVRVDGELRWSEERILLDGTPAHKRVWSVVRDDESAPGLSVEPGQRVELATGLAMPPDRSESLGPLATGFGRVRLIRRPARPLEQASPDRPNIVFVVADTQRRDRLSAYGYQRPTSPNVDSLARAGTLFERAYATSTWTWPSTASLFTGLTPFAHGVRAAPTAYLADELRTLAEILSSDGYRTAAFSGNPLVAARRNYDQGFERFDDDPLVFRRGTLLVDRALEWLDEVSHERFFLYVHLIDSHDPYLPLPEQCERLGLPGRPEGWRQDQENLIRQQLVLAAQRAEDGRPDANELLSAADREALDQLYDAATATTDAQLGRLLDAIAARGLEDRTLVIFTADHGEGLLERGLYGHGLTLHEEESGVPLVVAGPTIEAGARIEQPVSNRHLMPSIAKLLGLELRGAPGSVDLFHPRSMESGPILVSSDHALRHGRRSPTHSLRVGNEVLHWTPTADGPRFFAGQPDVVRLYDLAADPDALFDLANQRPERVAELLELLRERLDAESANAVVGALGTGEATLEMLRRAGYVEPEETE
ncbi:sulfatase [Engelhardtia mirabilis]|uniref:Choline-sulfatase n=1 Tax=Engelhardtia mirabilis TaxID=2528011 RepID=A0A518BKX2_9BACT|nr:Choline-sulfatase [Planctomycetes bacterium Pla133]QDV01942.1 Choline-sulfatase [Planctomycetes bacterium Pla86]